MGAAALCEEDVIVDVGTGSGKTLAFEIPLVLHATDIFLRVTPLTALMIDQASGSSAQKKEADRISKGCQSKCQNNSCM